MRSVAYVTAAVLAVIGIGVGVVAGPNPRPRGPIDESNWVTSSFRGLGVRVAIEHPPSWRVPPEQVFPTPTLGTLASFPVHSYCRSIPTGDVCTPAQLGTFPANGALIVLAANYLGPGLPEKVMPESGSRLSVDGRHATRVVGIVACDGVGAERSIEYEVIDGQIQGVLDVQFCFRGPAYSHLFEEMAGVMASLQITLDPTTVPTVGSSGFPIVTGGRPVPASRVPLCSPGETELKLAASQFGGDGTTTLRFTTTLRDTSSVACGMPILQSCATYGGVTVRSSSGRAVWEWAPTQLEIACASSTLQELPMSITSQPLIVPAGALAAGRYVATTSLGAKSADVSFDLH